MVQLTKLAGKVKIHLDDKYSLVSSTLHNKLELFNGETFIKSFSNLYAAIQYYEGLV